MAVPQGSSSTQHAGILTRLVTQRDPEGVTSMLLLSWPPGRGILSQLARITRIVFSKATACTMVYTLPLRLKSVSACAYYPRIE